MPCRQGNAHQLPGTAGSHAGSQMLCQRAIKCLRVDNTTAISFIKRMGGTISPRLYQLTRELLSGALHENVILRAVHIAGKLNASANEGRNGLESLSNYLQGNKQTTGTTSIFAETENTFVPCEFLSSSSSYCGSSYIGTSSYCGSSYIGTSLPSMLSAQRSDGS